MPMPMPADDLSQERTDEMDLRLCVLAPESLRMGILVQLACTRTAPNAAG